ncbi:hypothetical protein [Brevundimonas sp.]|uniref:hypothetical protein n=1 Tax=Brevundimonas sp. TaxID=1871086 RepID=UPI002D67E1B9|nr:hypothetical protein [Brevundimonas sp.]HYC97763.1 hypothetical protein [Brevundimonas sp.]
MTLFGRTLGGEEIASLVFLLMALVIWVMALQGERNWARWFRRWEADRKGRRDAELSMERNGDRPPPSSDGPRGPWG